MMRNAAEISDLPRISLVTPSFNSGRFIETTIRSVIQQGYSNLEYFVIDGGSTDETHAILERYRPQINSIVIEPDKGQSDAINKGLQFASGELFGWLCADDILENNALLEFANFYKKEPDAVLWTGGVNEIDESGTIFRTILPLVPNSENLKTWWYETRISQPATLFSTKAIQKLGGLNERYRYAMDVELYTRLWHEGKFAATEKILASFRRHDSQMSQKSPAGRECEVISAYWQNGHTDGAAGRLKPLRLLRLIAETILVSEKHFPCSSALKALLRWAFKTVNLYPSIR